MQTIEQRGDAGIGSTLMGILGRFGDLAGRMFEIVVPEAERRVRRKKLITKR
jgi:hypothetical protein